MPVYWPLDEDEDHDNDDEHTDNHSDSSANYDTHVVVRLRDLSDVICEVTIWWQIHTKI